MFSASNIAHRKFDVVIVGAGPSGSACAYWLAQAGWSVCLVEKKTFPREKTCGDGLTPRAVHQLADMGLTSQLEKYHRYEGLRATGMGRELELQWPTHPVYPSHGYVVRRHELDQMVGRMGFVREDELAALRRHVERLEQQLQDQSPAAPAAGRGARRVKAATYSPWSGKIGSSRARIRKSAACVGDIPGSPATGAAAMTAIEAAR